MTGTGQLSVPCQKAAEEVNLACWLLPGAGLAEAVAAGAGAAVEVAVEVGTRPWLDGGVAFAEQPARALTQTPMTSVMLNVTVGLRTGPPMMITEMPGMPVDVGHCPDYARLSVIRNAR